MNTIYSILGFIVDHWVTFSSVLLFIFTTVFGYKNPKTSAQDYAKSVGSKIIFGLEKRAEEYLISTGAEKLKLAVEGGYNLFPAKVRLFISKPEFEVIVQGLHDEAIKFLEDQIKKNTPVVEPTYVVTPAVVSEPVATNVTPIIATTVAVSQEALQAFIAQLPTTATTNSAISESGISANTIIAPENQITQP